MTFLDHTQTHHMSNPPNADTSTSQQIDMPPVGFEPTIPASDRPQTHALDRAATGVGRYNTITLQYHPAYMQSKQKSDYIINFTGTAYGSVSRNKLILWNLNIHPHSINHLKPCSVTFKNYEFYCVLHLGVSCDPSTHGDFFPYTPLNYLSSSVLPVRITGS